MGKKEKKNKKEKNRRKVLNKAVPATRLIAIISVAVIIFILLVIRIGWIQFVQGAELKELASRQQTLNKIISPNRGTIYDTNGKKLAMSTKVDTITINPKKIVAKENKKEIKATENPELQEKVAKGLADIFSLDYATVLAQVQSTKSTETIVKKVEQELVDKLTSWMKENNIVAGINIDEDSKRYYPYNDMAAYVIGFTGADSDGRYGIEHYWDSTLKGTSGKIVTAADVDGGQISDSAEQYIEAENGSDIYLTIDVNIQKIVEDYLKQGVTANGAAAGSCIIMNPKTGEILSMATYPSYDLNNPYKINSEDEQKNWDTYSSEEKNTKLLNMWGGDRNFSKTYEPGSTFKLIVAAAALEEGITSTDVAGDFHCEGFTTVADREIKCAASAVHGSQTLRMALRNSCNAAFIQLGQRVGKNTLYRYFEAFGFFERTGFGVTGESRSNFHSLDELGPVELATTSFGQRFDITPLQLITAVSAIANNGTLIEPKIVKRVVNSSTKTETEIEAKEQRKVISEKTAKELRDMMKSVVEDRENIYGDVKGYTIGGKTGTSEPPVGHPEEGYVVSYIATAPADAPEIVTLVVVYKPDSKDPYGSRIAAPIASNILNDVLPYLGITSEDSDTTGTTATVSKTTKVTDVTNKTLTEAKKTLENLGFTVICADNPNSNSILVTEQVPGSGTVIQEGGVVCLYTDENTVRTSVEVPDLTGMTLQKARSTLAEKNLNILYSGSGTVKSQSIGNGSTVEQGSVITIYLE